MGDSSNYECLCFSVNTVNEHILPADHPSIPVIKERLALSNDTVLLCITTGRLLQRLAVYALYIYPIQVHIAEAAVFERDYAKYLFGGGDTLQSISDDEGGTLPVNRVKSARQDGPISRMDRANGDSSSSDEDDDDEPVSDRVFDDEEEEEEETSPTLLSPNSS
jgi:hypothetical protein